MQPATNSRWDRPIFVASMGRSGSTLLQRLLNVHPDITIWGEHGGFLHGFFQSYGVTLDPNVQANLADGFEHRGAVIGELSDKATFKPWVSPFRTEDLAEAVRDLTTGLFTKGLPANVRWGFKEIRYHARDMAVLMDLYPESHMIVLARDIPGYAMSRFFAFGQTDFDLVSDEGRAKASARLSNMSRGWIERYQGLVELAEQHPDRSSFVAYSDLVSGSDRPRQLFHELGEPNASETAIAEVLDAKSGSSFRFNADARENREVLEALIADAEYDREEAARLSEVLGLT